MLRCFLLHHRYRMSLALLVEWVCELVLSMWNGCQVFFHLGSLLTRPQLSLPTVPHDSLTNCVSVHWYTLSCSRDAGLYRHQFHLPGSCHIRWALKICSISRLSWFFLTFTFRYNFSSSLSVSAKNSTLGFWCGLHWTCSSVWERSQLYHIELSSSYMIYLLRFSFRAFYSFQCWVTLCSFYYCYCC